MNVKRAKRFKKEILKALRTGPKTTVQLYKIIKQKCPKYCDDRVKYITMGGHKPEPEWKHGARCVQNSMQKDFLIYHNVGSGKWEIVE